MAKHNKKRNIGIIYELLLREISSCLIENNLQGVKRATKILEKHFNKDTEIYKEFRLVNALTTSNVKNTEVAAAILTEAKSAIRRSNPKKIDREKSSLIKDINYQIPDRKFYYRSIPNYVDYANIHNLLNEWRRKDESDFKKVIELESKAIQILLKEKNNTDVFHEKSKMENTDSDKLVFKIMTEKINNKYSNMSKHQKEIIKNYALYNDQKDQKKLVNFLSEKKNRCLLTLEKFERENSNSFVGKKINNVRDKINSLNENNVSDESIIKFMTIMDLISEIEGK